MEEGKEGIENTGVRSQTRVVSSGKSHITLCLTNTHTQKSSIGSIKGNLKLIGTLRFVSDLIF